MRGCGTAVVLALCAGVPCAAAYAEPRVSHEYVPGLDPNEANVAVARSGDGTAAQAPGRRSPRFRPDTQTDLQGALQYFEAFTPAIAPFKRVTSLDAVELDADGITPVLTVAATRHGVLPITSADPLGDGRARDRFWGDVALDFSEGPLVPLPSVAPGMRVLHVDTTPPVALELERDGADNYFARLRSARPSGPVRLVFLVDAPRSYFGAEIPPVPLSQLGAAPALPPSVAARALAVAAALGLSRRDDLRTALATLTRHFREFVESSEPLRGSGDVYVDLARGKQGICRHRAYAFVITAQALGITSRFVQNEAHSWVEVLLPGLGFLRIDLGGAAHGLTAHGVGDRPSYVPAQTDTLPRPPSYEQSDSVARAAATGPRPRAQDVTGRFIEPEERAGTEGDAVMSIGPRSGGPADTSGRAPLTLELEHKQRTVLRGGKVTIQGRLVSASRAGVRGLRVEVSLVSQDGAKRMLLGVTVSDDDGYFQAAVGVPTDLAVGDYRLVVLTPGNAQYLPVVSE